MGDFKVGDKVVVVGENSPYHVGTELIIKSFYISVNNYECFKAHNGAVGCSLDDVIPLEIYNSPLYRVLQE